MEEKRKRIAALALAHYILEHNRNKYEAYVYKFQGVEVNVGNALAEIEKMVEEIAPEVGLVKKSKEDE